MKLFANPYVRLAGRALIAGLLAAGVLWAVESRYPDLLVISHG